MTFSKKQQIVLKIAKEKLEKEDWFDGVCLDNFPTDQDIERDGIESCAESVYYETALWDAPLSY